MDINRNKINRSFFYGDLLFETIRVANGQAMHIALHFERLQRGLQLMAINGLALDADRFSQLIAEEIAANNLIDARIRFTVLRGGEGGYRFSHAEPQIHIHSEALAKAQLHVCNMLGLFEEIKRPIHPLSTIKTGQALTQIMAGLAAQKYGWDDCVILNENQTVACTIQANIFILKNNRLKTTNALQGAICGIMQQVVTNLANMPVDHGVVTLNDLQEAEEIFLTNAIRKVVPVLSFNNKTYATDFARLLYGLIP